MRAGRVVVASMAAASGTRSSNAQSKVELGTSSTPISTPTRASGQVCISRWTEAVIA